MAEHLRGDSEFYTQQVMHVMSFWLALTKDAALFGNGRDGGLPNKFVLYVFVTRKMFIFKLLLCDFSSQLG